VAKSRQFSFSRMFVSFSIREGIFSGLFGLVKGVRGCDILAMSATKRLHTPHIPRELFIWVRVSGYRRTLSARKGFFRTCTRPGLITMAEVLHFVLKEVAFGRLQGDPCLSWALQHLVEVLQVLFWGR